MCGIIMTEQCIWKLEFVTPHGLIGLLNSNPSTSAIQTVKQGILNENGAITIRPGLDSFIIFSFHSAKNSDGGCIVFTSPYYANVIKNTFHNNGTCNLSGDCDIGITITTNAPNGKYRIIIFKNYDA